MVSRSRQRSITSRSSAGTSSLLVTGLNNSPTAADKMNPAPDIRDGIDSRGTTRA